jgi:hypothetical protein
MEKYYIEQGGEEYPKEKTGYSKMKQEALDRTLWRIHFGRGNGPVVRQCMATLRNC